MIFEDYQQNDLFKCRDEYLSPRYGAMHQMIMKNKRLTFEALSDWVNAFCEFQIMTGVLTKGQYEFNRHALMWLNKQDLSKDPNSLSKADKPLSKFQQNLANLKSSMNNGGQ